MQRPEKIKNVLEKIHARARKLLSSEIATLCGPVAVDEKRFMAAARNSSGEKGEYEEE